MRRVSHNKFGPELVAKGVRFRLWAPNHPSVLLTLEGERDPYPMVATGDGWHVLKLDAAGPGNLYRFILSDGIEIPDPASRFQPQDVHGPSEVIDPAGYDWRDGDWHGRVWEEAVIYELHVGAFTAEGTFAAAIEKLDTVKDIGITAIELMPVADFPGRWNWGYDGVQLFAPDSSYGRPEDLKAFVDAAHRRGLMVFLDVVYNHLGPNGNYLPACGPIFTERHRTPWGAGMNFDAEGSSIVRDFIIANALYWIEEFNLDGLRLDAVHAIADDSEIHILEAIAASVRNAVGDRHVHLILENDDNSASRLRRASDGKPVQYSAQWNDDLHHSLHTAAAGELLDYYIEYSGNTERLGRALAEGFSFQGEWTIHNPRKRGEPSASLPSTAFVAFLQNHDQIGNRPFGDRIVGLAPLKALRAVTALFLLSPQIPMLFMGEEWATSRPFTFFCDFEGTLAEAVRAGRRCEFARYPDFDDPDKRDRIPDPIAATTFSAAKLDWNELDKLEHREWREFYRRLLMLRHAEVVPRLKGMLGHSGSFEVLGSRAVRVRWTLGEDSVLTLLANLKTEAEEAAIANEEGRVLWMEGHREGGSVGPWTVIFSLSDGHSDDR